jgi:hypothetical protein
VLSLVKLYKIYGMEDLFFYFYSMSHLSNIYSKSPND